MNRKKLTLVLTLLGATLGIIFTIVLFTNPNLGGEDTNALVGGSPDTLHPYVGYIISDSNSVCAGTLLDKNTIITAGHCLSSKSGNEFFFGTGSFTTDLNKLIKIIAVKYADDFSHKTSEGTDIAIAKLSGEVLLSQYAVISQPQVGCEQTIVAYGSGIETAAPTNMFQRKFGSGCTESVGPIYRLKLDDNVGICYGDSGGGIFSAPTSNRLVGVLSGGIVDPTFQKLLCETSNEAVVVSAGDHFSQLGFENISDSDSARTFSAEYDLTQLNVDLTKYLATDNSGQAAGFRIDLNKLLENDLSLLLAVMVLLLFGVLAAIIKLKPKY